MTGRPTVLLALIAGLGLARPGHAMEASSMGSAVGADCAAKGKVLKGKVKVVDHFADLKVKVVDHFPDLKVKMVEHFPDECGEWKMVEHFPDFTITYVDHFADVEVKMVEHFPGLP